MVMAKSFEIGDVKVEPGKKGNGWIRMAKTYYGELKVPVMIANGCEDGKTLFLCSGVHGTEYAGIDAILRLMESLDVSKLKGRVLAIPFLNVPAFESITRDGPFDSLNLNRIFPGKRDGFITERLANLVTEEVFPKINYAIDLHGATLNDLQVSICGFFMSEEGHSLQMAKAFGIETLWDLGSSGLKGTFNSTATEQGIPNIVVEVGGEGRCLEEWVQREIRGFMNVMKALDMVEGSPEGLPSKYQLTEGFYQHGTAGGFLRPMVKLSSPVKRGELLGSIIDLHGNVLEEVRSPMDGKVMGLRTLPKINPGEWTFWIGKTVREIS
jgi:predicted deacylase